MRCEWLKGLWSAERLISSRHPAGSWYGWLLLWVPQGPRSPSASCSGPAAGAKPQVTLGGGRVCPVPGPLALLGVTSYVLGGACMVSLPTGGVPTAGQPLHVQSAARPTWSRGGLLLSSGTVSVTVLLAAPPCLRRWPAALSRLVFMFNSRKRGRKNTQGPLPQGRGWGPAALERPELSAVLGTGKWTLPRREDQAAGCVLCGHVQCSPKSEHAANAQQ